ncbi:hypothetical protein AG1IA_08827 [Rhizoctonia solani AG-1 IA]|uniref:Uncharacterized protein n=1 Tax=Thanatephorus cucumeris (strain AG1-IA) TaxID=983506 RepID=L8WGR8_THACA|nr:hypothetical protein AG1IA_08827 [Rhizoctonia solani AG-1 IA]
MQGFLRPEKMVAPRLQRRRQEVAVISPLVQLLEPRCQLELEPVAHRIAKREWRPSPVVHLGYRSLWLARRWFLQILRR